MAVNKSSRNGKNQRSFVRRMEMSENYNTINLVTGILIIILAILIFILRDRFPILFFFVFLLGAVNNINLGMKYYKMKNIPMGIFMIIAGAFFVLLTLYTFLAFVV